MPKSIKKVSINIIWFFLLFTLTINLIGQNTPLFNNISRNNGLKEISYNSFILKDSKGYIWISSLNSLGRFDGNTIKSYPTNGKTKKDIKGNYIQGNFFEDYNNDIWFATWEAINRYNRNSDNFTSFQVINPDTINKSYHLFHIDEFGKKIWFLADKGIYHLNTSEPRIQTKLPIETESSRFTLVENELGEKTIYGAPWMSNTGLEIIYQENDIWKKKKLPLVEIGSPNISQILYSKENNTLWLVSNFGLIQFNPSAPQTSQLFHLDKDFISGFWNGVFIDNKTIVLSSNNKGLWYFDLSTEYFYKSITNLGNDKNEIKNNDTRELYLDNQNNLWVNLQDDGVDFMWADGVFPFYFIDLTIQNKNSTVIEFYEEHKNVFLASGNNGLFILEKSNKNSYQLKNHLLQNLPVFDLFLNVDTSLNINSTEFYALRKNKTIKALVGQEVSQIRSPILLKNGKVLGAEKNKLVFVEIRNKEIKTREIKNQLNNTYIKLFQKANGDILGSLDASSLHVITYTNKQDSLFLKYKINNTSDILSFFQNTYNENIWCGTTNGLGLLDKNNNFNYLLQEDWQIGKNSVFSVVEDNQKRLWIGANNGFWTYNLTTNKLIKLRPENGIGDKTFMPNAQLKAKDGTLWFGTSEGALYFDPDSISMPSSKPKVEIESAWINDKPYEKIPVIGETAILDLEYSENSFGFRIVCLDFQLPKYNQVRYRFRGYEEEWKLIKSGERINFNQIPSGKTYYLEVIGINANYIESPLKRLEIKIALPFWQAWWFPLLVLSAIIALSLAIANIYVQRKLKAQQIEMDKRAALNQQRNTIANDLHDDIGNDLSQIISMSDYAILKESGEAKGILNDIADLAADSVKNLRYTMWSLDEKNNELSNLLFKLREYAYLFSKRHNLPTTVTIQDDIPAIEIDGKVRREIYLFFKEGLNNIKKYANATRVEINAKLIDNQLAISIKDNGIGFDLEERKGKGKGLLTMEERAASLNGQLTIKSSLGAGTFISLTFPLS